VAYSGLSASADHKDVDGVLLPCCTAGGTPWPIARRPLYAICGVESRPIVTHSHPLDTGVLQLTRKGVFPSLAKEGCRAEQQMRRY
jgi:hypothetical protein